MKRSSSPSSSPPRRRTGVFRVGIAETNRVEAFSDGVFAIVVTLLVLDLRLPTPPPDAAHLWEALYHLMPTFLAWAISFAFVMVIWVNHHYLFSQLRRVDKGLLWLNGLLLFALSFVPFPTSLAGQYFLAAPGLLLLSAAMFVVSVSFSAMRWYAGFAADLVDERVPHAERLSGLRRSFVGPIAYLLAMASATWAPIVSLTIQVAVPVVFFLRSPSHSAPLSDPPASEPGPGTAVRDK